MAKKYVTDTYVPPCLQLRANFVTPVPSYNPCLVLRGQHHQQLADMLVQVPPNTSIACCRVAGGDGCSAWIRFGWCSIFDFLASAACLSDVICVSGFGVVRVGGA